MQTTACKEKTRVIDMTLSDGSKTYAVNVAAPDDVLEVRIEAMDYDHALRIQRAIEGGMTEMYVITQ